MCFQPPSPAASTISMLNDDTNDLIERLADAQQDKWLLEEKVHSIFKERSEHEFENSRPQNIFPLMET